MTTERLIELQDIVLQEKEPEIQAEEDKKFVADNKAYVEGLFEGLKDILRSM